MAKLLLLALSIARIATACQRELRSLDLGLNPQNIPLVPRQETQFPPIWTLNERFLHESFSTATISNWSSYYTHGNHIAGLNKSMAEETARQWTENGVSADLVEYEVFLNYPKEQRLILKLGNGSHYEAQMFEDGLADDETTTYSLSVNVPAFHGYSASGAVEAEYVYVGRAQKDDFAALLAANVSLEGKIALAKYGGPYRGVKVRNAERAGMSGVVVFSDPGDDGPQVAKGDAAYPDGPARNPSSLQRGSVVYIDDFAGDPTTPGYASKPGVPRLNNPPNLPTIPSLPISYRDALPLLRALDGHGKVFDRGGWIGGLNATYSTGPAPGTTLSLTNIMEEKITPIWNVIGTINGTNAEETVIIGNHRDAWIVGGAADPNSGSAVLIEMTRAFGDLVKTGWSPRRNIVFASWDAEEYALVGSTEWVEEHTPWLSHTAITYLNIDIGVSGPLPGAAATPGLRTLAQEVMKLVSYNNENRTLYGAWYELYQFYPESRGFGNLGSGSDYTAFLQLGIPVLDFGLDASRESAVYHYHSNYDSYHWMSTVVDPQFSLHATVGRFMTLLAYHLADDVVLGFDMDAFARNINYYIRELVGETMRFGDDYGQIQRKLNISALDRAAKMFQHIATDFMDTIAQPSFLDDTARVERANRAMVATQKLFVREEGLPGRLFYRNALWAPNRDDGYRAQILPGSMEALQDGDLERCREWNLWLMGRIGEATRMLAEV